MSKLACPRCGTGVTHVIDTRPFGEGMLRRVRECTCGHYWNTVELEYDSHTERAIKLRMHLLDQELKRLEASLP